MRLCMLTCRNFRTLSDFQLKFPEQYCAICGKNNAGKTTVVRALQVFFPRHHSPVLDDEDIDYQSSFPVWKNKRKTASEPIELAVQIGLTSTADPGLTRFVDRIIQANTPAEQYYLSVNLRLSKPGNQPEVTVNINEKALGAFESTEIFKRIRTSSVVFYHNSTELDRPMFFHRARRLLPVRLAQLGVEDRAELARAQNAVQRFSKKLAKHNQEELASLLGKLEDKYKVGLTFPQMDFEDVPMEITLAEKDSHVSLDDWGSGTRNRTNVFLTLLNAAKIRDTQIEDERISPVYIIEEPESYLHPSAQAEFGRVLQDLSREFRLQLVVTTHSPYMLNQREPVCNILLERQVYRRQLRETQHVATDGEDWMKPFALALGVDNSEFGPWKDLILAGGSKILLVEGETDKEYFEIMRDERNGVHRLRFDGEIFPYNGKDNLRNAILLKFIIERYRSVFVTFDLDASVDLSRTLTALNLKENVDFFPVGMDEDGKRDIEGLLPDGVMQAVYGVHHDVVRRATSGDATVRKSARASLKKLLLDEFKRTHAFSSQHMKGFWTLASCLNKAARRSS